MTTSAKASPAKDVVRTGEPPAGLKSAESRELSSLRGNSIAELLHLAIERGTPVDALEKLVALHERLADREAAQEFARALAAFQAECPPIHKSSTAKVATRSGTAYSYSYAELDEIARTVNPILARHGLSYSWDSKVEKDSLSCVCTLRHVNGHSVPSNFALPIENQSAMNAQQKVGAALTYAKRQSLTSALGLTTTDDDPDAASVDPTPISEDQLLVLEELLSETKADRKRFLKYLTVSKLEELPAVRFDEALSALEAKKARAT